MATESSAVGSRPQPQPVTSQTQQVPTFLQTAGKTTKLFFAGLAIMSGLASFCVGITITPFSQESGMAAFAIGTSLFGLAGILLFNQFKPTAPDLASRQITARNSSSNPI